VTELGDARGREPVLQRPLLWQPRSSSTAADSSLIGEKAAGLVRVAAYARVPPYLVLTTEWSYRGVAAKSQLQDAATEEEWLDVSRALAEILTSAPMGVCLRPSVPGEPMSQRGSTVSRRIEGDFHAILSEIQEMLRWNRVATVIALIVQHFVGGQLGHLSNEFRLMRDSSHWLIEHQASAFDSPRATTSSHIRSTSRTEIKNTPPSAAARLRTALELLAASFSHTPQRWHFEWVFDGENLWIVQADREDPPPDAPAPGETWMGQIMTPLPTPTWPLRPFIQGENTEFPKLRWQSAFARVGGQTTTFVVMDDKQTWELLLHGEVSKALKTAIESLVEGGPLVARTDIATEDVTKSLPRSDCLLTSTRAVEFLVEKVASSQRLRDAQQRILIFHRFIPARACAFAYARGEREAVQIDATFGVPDGLSVYPHDTFIVAADTNLVRRRIRYKGTYLDVMEDGSWMPQLADPRLGWSPSLSDAQAVEMSRISRTMSRQEKRPLLVMFFASGHRETMPTGILPWILDYEVPPPGNYGEISRGLFNVPIVHDVDSLQRIATGNPPSRVIYRPPSAAIRDDARHLAVGELAWENGVTLIWEGSVLAHVWYVLARSGAIVLPVATEEDGDDDPGTQEFNKLVRDGVPAKIERAGERALTATVSGDMLVRLLRQKLIEEAIEVFEAANRQELGEEIADLREVLEALTAAARLDPAEIEEIQNAKRSARGGFERGIVLRQTMIPPSVSGLQVGDNMHGGLSDRQIWELTDALPSSDGEMISVPRVPSHLASEKNRKPVSLSVKGHVFDIYEYAKMIVLRYRGAKRRSTAADQLNLIPPN
jgi:predicted house-cleaning noncanonical NTP pyrophosphatase (MazG superfamily)